MNNTTITYLSPLCVIVPLRATVGVSTAARLEIMVLVLLAAVLCGHRLPRHG